MHAHRPVLKPCHNWPEWRPLVDSDSMLLLALAGSPLSPHRPRIPRTSSAPHLTQKARFPPGPADSPPHLHPSTPQTQTEPQTQRWATTENTTESSSAPGAWGLVWKRDKGQAVMGTAEGTTRTVQTDPETLLRVCCDLISQLQHPFVSSGPTLSPSLDDGGNGGWEVEITQRQVTTEE